MATCANCGFTSEEDFKFCSECGTQRVGEAGVDPLLGRTLAGKYRVVEEIGAGSMGTVYRAEQIALKKRIAIKLLRRDLQVTEEALRRFQREGIAAGQVSHPNVIQIFDFDRTDDGLFYLAMEFVDGANLKAFLAQRGALPPAEAIDLMRQLLSTLVEAHSHGIVHRDLKPENVMIAESAVGDQSVKVLDFGLSKLVDRPLDVSQQTIPGRVLGTPMYMAPEQWRGESVDHRTDLYAASLILYELIAGQPPFSGKDVTDAMIKTTSKAPPSLMESQTRHAISPELDQIVQRGLAKAPDDRYQSAAEMLADINAVQLDGRARRPHCKPRQTATSGERKPKLAVIAATALVAMIALLWFLFGGGGSGAEGSTTPALLSARRTAELDPEQRAYVSLLEDARDRLADGDPHAARAVLEDAMALPCSDAEAHVVQAMVHRRLGDDDAAAKDYSEAIAQSPGYGEAIAGLGWIRFEAGDLDAAQEQFDAAPSSGHAIAGKAAVMYARGEHDAALELLDSAAATHPDNALVQLWRGRVRLEKSDFDGAVQAFGRAKRNDPSSWEAFEGLGDAYLAKGNLEAAEKQYGDALDIGADSERVRRKLVQVLLTDGRFDSAAATLAPAIKENGTDPELLVLLGVAEQGRRQPDKAIEALRGAIGGGDPAVRCRALVLLATLELQTGDFASASEHCEAAAEIEDTSAALFQTWGLALFRGLEFAEAAAKLERVTELEPTATFVRLQLGLIYKDYIGNHERARAHLKAYLENGGTDPRAQEWIDLMGGD